MASNMHFCCYATKFYVENCIVLNNTIAAISLQKQMIMLQPIKETGMMMTKLCTKPRSENTLTRKAVPKVYDKLLITDLEL